MSSAKEPYISRTNIHVLVIEWSEVQRSEGIDKRALYFPKKNPMSSAKEPLLQKSPGAIAACRRIVSITGKRALYFQQKSPIFPTKEPYILSKRALYPPQKSLISPKQNPLLLFIEWSEVQRNEEIAKLSATVILCTL